MAGEAQTSYVYNDSQEAKTHRDPETKFLIGLHLQTEDDLPRQGSKNQVECRRVDYSRLISITTYIGRPLQEHEATHSRQKC